MHRRGYTDADSDADANAHADAHATPTPTPTGGAVCVNSAGQSVPLPSNAVEQVMLSEGSNNYVYDGTRNDRVAANSIQYYKLPMATANGTSVSAGTINFSDYIQWTPSTIQVEIALSKCPGDFSYYRSDPATYRFTPGGLPYLPCGLTTGPIGTISWAPYFGYDQCAIPTGQQWYVNWRILSGTCPDSRGLTCGQVMVWHRTY